MVKNENIKTAAMEDLVEQRELEFINHIAEARRLRTEYALHCRRIAQLQAEEANLAYKRLQVTSGISCVLSLFTGLALGIAICLMNWI